MIENWTNKIFYHGSNSPDFDRFDESRVGSAHDAGWYGHGFYFAFTPDEASHYGTHIRKATLDIKNPFFFTENLQQFEDQSTNIFGDLAVFAINMTRLFPDLAEQLKIKTLPNKEPRIPVYISFAQYAQDILSVYYADELRLFEGRDGRKPFFGYRWENDYNKFLFRFPEKAVAEESRMNVAASYVNNEIYGFVDGHSSEYYLSLVSDKFSKMVQDKGYDGIIQSKDGDEVLCFKPEQVHWIN